MSKRFEAALQYAARGWPVLALHTVRPDGACGCGGHTGCSAGKHPRWRHGLKDATLDTRRIRRWGARWEQSNIGIRTGAASGLWVLDVDPRHGGDQSLRALEEAYEPLPPTLECLTGGGGRHIYFAHPGEPTPNSSGRLGPGLDTRGDGGYVVAPPSSHTEGVYRWKAPLSADQPLVKAPAWLLARLGRRPTASACQAARTTTVPEGQRNERMFSLAGALRRQGMDPKLIETVLQTVNTRWLEAPLSESELRALAHSIGRYAAGALDAEAILTRLSEVEPAEIHWLWPGRIPLGKLTLMAGDPGLGKSLVTLDMAARVSTGKDWPDVPTPQTNAAEVILLAAEDDLGDTVRPRMDQAGADPQRVHVVTAVRTPKATRPFNLAEDLEQLRRAMAAIPDPRLVIIDPITAYLGEAEAQSNAEIRALLAPLSALAAELSVAVVAVTHLRKSGGKAIYRAMGSLAFAAAARAVWGVAKDPDHENRQLLVPVKMNIGPQPTALAYSIQEGPVVDWDPNVVHVTADTVLGDAAKTSAVQDAADFLSKALKNGPHPAVDIEKQARQQAISKASLKRARHRLRIRSRRDDAGRWVLSLPQNNDSRKRPTKTPPTQAQELPLFATLP